MYGVRSPFVISDNRSPITHQERSTLVIIKKGLESFERGEGIPADRAMTALQQQFNIPPGL
ncbi:MAG: hypothetical protein ACM65L_16370 [Microcoleus sp.]